MIDLKDDEIALRVYFNQDGITKETTAIVDREKFLMHGTNMEAGLGRLIEILRDTIRRDK